MWTSSNRVCTDVLGRIEDCSLEYQDAVGDVYQAISRVINNLRDIFTSAPGVDIAGFVTNINTIRCCNVIPDLTLIWREAAEVKKLVGQVNTTVGTPAVCATIKCQV